MPFAPSEYLAVIFSFVGPVVSAFAAICPLNPNAGINAVIKTMIPIPPSQCVKDRQNRIDLGSDSMSVNIDAPVVLKPDADSKKASAKFGMYPEI